MLKALEPNKFLLVPDISADHHLLCRADLRPKWGRGRQVDAGGGLSERRRLADDQWPFTHRLRGVQLQGEERREVLLEYGQPHRPRWVPSHYNCLVAPSHIFSCYHWRKKPFPCSGMKGIPNCSKKSLLFQRVMISNSKYTSKWATLTPSRRRGLMKSCPRKGQSCVSQMASWK